MKTHENTDGSDDMQIEFCWSIITTQMNDNFSESIINALILFIAWRAGFREGVKMSLNRGTKVPRRCKRNMVAKLL